MQKVSFKNNALESQFSQDGYVLIKDFIDLQKVEKLRKVYFKYHIERREDLMWNTLYHIPVEESKKVSSYILKLLNDELQSLFEEFRAPLATIMSKCAMVPKGLDTPHRDYSVADEDEVEYRNIWIPLVDIAFHNGPMMVIPGSHKYPHATLPVMGKCSYRDYHEELKDRFTEPIFMNSGDLLVYADRTIHAGLPNYSAHERPVVHFGILPKSAKLYYFSSNRSEEGKVDKFEIPDDWYLKARDFNNPPLENAKFIGTYDDDRSKIEKFLNNLNLVNV